MPMNIQWIGCAETNFGKGRGGNKVNSIVLHWIVGTLKSADATFANPTRGASAHYGVGGAEIHQYVKEEDTAWHAGNLTRNKQSIGIEHEGGPDLPVSEATVQTSIQLVADICRRYSIPADKDHIKKHSEIKATQCPGTLPVDRIIEEAAKLLQPAVPPVVTPIDPDKVKVDLGGDLGTMEVQAIRSKLLDLERSIKQQSEENTGLTTQVKSLKEARAKLAELLNCPDDFSDIQKEVAILAKKEEHHEEKVPNPIDLIASLLAKLLKRK